MKSVDEYLAENIGMDEFLDAASIQEEYMKRVLKSRNSFLISVFVIAFLLFGYIVITGRIYNNMFEQKNKEKGFENSGCNFEYGLQFGEYIIRYNATKAKTMLPIFQSDLPPCSREILQGDTRSRHLLY